MITREELRQLAQVESPQNSAVTFYFQPQVPQNKSHKEELIQIKDLVREALRRAEKNGNNPGVRADLKRILDLAEQLHGNHARGKAVFACSAQGIWREFDLPRRLHRTQLYVDRRFHIRPVAAVAASSPRCCIALVTRDHGRFFRLAMGEIKELPELVSTLPRRGRSDGFLGYDGGHAERHVENEAMRHFKLVAERLQEAQAREGCDHFLVGCRDEIWPDVQAPLHTYVKQKLLGHFNIDPNTVTPEQVREQAQRLLEERAASRREALVREVLGSAQRNGRGAVGLRDVLASLERGEVQTLLFGEWFFTPAVECGNCGHLDVSMVESCPACGQPTRELEDAADAILRRALDAGIEVAYIGAHPDLEKAGKIGALLRFRAEQSTSEKMVG